MTFHLVWNQIKCFIKIFQVLGFMRHLSFLSTWPKHGFSVYLKNFLNRKFQITSDAKTSDWQWLKFFIKTFYLIPYQVKRQMNELLVSPIQYLSMWSTMWTNKGWFLTQILCLTPLKNEFFKFWLFFCDLRQKLHLERCM